MPFGPTTKTSLNTSIRRRKERIERHISKHEAQTPCENYNNMDPNS